MKAMSHYLGGRELLGDGGAKVLATGGDELRIKDMEAQ